VVDRTLAVPALLQDLVQQGVWPADWDQARDFESAYSDSDASSRHRTELLKRYGPKKVPLERIRLIHPNETRLCLFPPPFLPSRQHTHCAWHLKGPAEGFFAPEEIDRDLMIEIGDFGHGADQPIILDFQKDPKAPNVCRLVLSIVRSGPEGRRKSWNNHWIEIAPSFDHFARLLGFV